MENPSDRQAAQTIDWTYALGLPLEDNGFDFSVFSESRKRLASGGKKQLFLDKMLQRFQEKMLLKAGANNVARQMPCILL